MRVRHLGLLLPLVPLALIWACAGDPTSPRPTGPVVAYVIVSGNGQTGTVGQDLPQPIRVLATDANDQPVPNVVVNFVTTGGGGSVFAGSALTDAAGIAAEIWTLGTVAGSPQTLEVRAVDAAGVRHVYGLFTATAVAVVPTAIVAVAGDGQTADAGAAVAVPPSVRLTDQFGNLVPNQIVTFAVGSGGGSVTGGSATTNAQGIATVGSWILGPLAGVNTLTAIVAALPGNPVSFSATATTAVVPLLGLATAPSTTGQSGVALATQPVIQLQDAQSNPINQAGVQITVSLNGVGATLGGTTTVSTDANGRAVFTNLVITGTVGSYSLSFSGAGLTTITSGSISLTPGAPAALILSAGDGQSAVTGTAVPIAPAVLVVDQSGNAVAGVSVTFTVNLGGGSVTGATVVSGSNGIATVGSWVLGSAPGSNILVASSAATPTSSVTFTATGTAPPGNFWNGGLALMKTARRYTSYGVINGILYVSGGRTFNGVAYQLEAYNPATNIWTTKTTPTIRRNGAAFGVINGLLYVVGGTDQNSVKLASMDAYNPTTNTWAVKAPLPEVKDFAAAAVINGILYVAGGGGAGNGISNTLYAYDPGTNTWTQKASLPAARGDLVGASLGGLFYAVGGSTTTGPDGAMQAYDPATDTWSNRAPVPAQRYHLNVAVTNGKLYAVGGFLPGGTTSNRLDSYDPATNTWTQGANMLTGRVGMAMDFINGVLYASGGYTAGTAASTTGVTEKYTP
ncbi:MAG: kelch repeat-containing protein [Gemmatimonadota bacterium]|nr:kelch repeat-containing protein [Gemmatimonadota bacterium]